MDTPLADDLLLRLRRFHDDTFPGVQDQFQNLVKDGQHPTILFIGCSDSRLVKNKKEIMKTIHRRKQLERE